MKIKINSIIYYYITIMILISMFYMTPISSNIPMMDSLFGMIIILMRVSMITGAIVNIINSRITSKRLLMIIVYLIIMVLSYATIRKWVIFDMFFIALFFGDCIDYHKVVNIFFRTILICTGIIIVSNLIGLFNDYTFYRGDGRIRYTFGFSHPNTLGFTIMTICMLYTLKKKSISFLQTIMIAVVGLMIYILPNSQSTAVVTILMALIIGYKNLNLKGFKKNLKKQEKRLYLLSVLLLLGIILGVYFISVKGVGTELVISLSSTFYTRFKYGYEAIQKYGFSVFGQQIEMIGEMHIRLNGGSMADYFTLDCVYLYLPIVVGVIPSLLIMAFYIHYMTLAIRERNISLLMVMCLFLIYGVSEVHITSFVSSYMFICAESYNSGNKRSYWNSLIGDHEICKGIDI